uniref:Uncharacterized protein n=1 Tax=Podoviridae sp. ct8Lf7 TaxID=2827723 RepID=A0A8S5S1N6_9CAUD|nr:MAG TPA: hypothetical protein [Podoviridae sp. ct8Lf7]
MLIMDNIRVIIYITILMKMEKTFLLLVIVLLALTYMILLSLNL